MIKRLAALSVAALFGCVAVSDDTQRTDSAPNGTGETPAEGWRLSDGELLDSAIAPATGGRDGWNYQQRTNVDLNGDGLQESIVITAQVEMYRGRPAWDDGQAWQVYLVPGRSTTGASDTTGSPQSDSGAVRLYAQRLQLGKLTLRVTRSDGVANLQPTILLIEHLPERLSIYEVTYDRSGNTATFLRLRRSLDPRGEQASVM